MPKKPAKGDTFAPKFDMYGSMAHYIAQKLHIRPSTILDTWSVPELLVAYGTFANEDAKQNFNDWKNQDAKQRNKITRPREYIVYFVGEI